MLRATWAVRRRMPPHSARLLGGAQVALPLAAEDVLDSPVRLGRQVFGDLQPAHGNQLVAELVHGGAVAVDLFGFDERE